MYRPAMDSLLTHKTHTETNHTYSKDLARTIGKTYALDLIAYPNDLTPPLVRKAAISCDGRVALESAHYKINDVTTHSSLLKTS